ncbi:hypothetical protein GCM10010429_22250 [Micromonospora olivasterospora]
MSGERGGALVRRATHLVVVVAHTVSVAFVNPDQAVRARPTRWRSYAAAVCVGALVGAVGVVVFQGDPDEPLSTVTTVAAIPRAANFYHGDASVRCPVGGGTALTSQRIGRNDRFFRHCL